MADGGILFRVAVLNSEIDVGDIANSTRITGAMLIAALAYIPVSIVMWFAPILVAWHDVPPAKALFFSWIALWRNRWAFTVYTLCWGALDIAITLPLTQIAALAGGTLLALMVVIPVMVAIVAMLYCSFYATYRGSFDVPDSRNRRTRQSPRPRGQRRQRDRHGALWFGRRAHAVGAPAHAVVPVAAVGPYASKKNSGASRLQSSIGWSLATDSASHFWPLRRKLTCARASVPAPSSAVIVPSPNFVWNTACPTLKPVSAARCLSA